MAGNAPSFDLNGLLAASKYSNSEKIDLSLAV
jgi:hypothetical protein